jgi:cob(I)alamin adenosyltransferase
MVKIYTKKGDDGSTSLRYGGRVQKTDARTEAYGSIDEANSALGVARALCPTNESTLASDVLLLQQDLFVAGAELATAPEAADRLEDGVSRVTDGMVDSLEDAIDRYMRQVDLPPQFVIPGGTELSAALDVARTAIRRAERRVVALNDSEGLEPGPALRYLNRASDLVFAMARYSDESNPQLFEGRKGSDGKS